jgi:RimJ/RimL family protein N-acetyltransferase
MIRLDTLSYGIAEISILVEPSLQGNGLGSRILKQSIEHAFNRLSYFELRASIHIENIASKKLFSKFGFVQTEKDLFISYKLSKIN